MESIWKYNLEMPQKDSLQEDTHIQTLIIGGGMAGVLTAYLLKQRGIESVIVEAKTIGSGQTENTTAKITSQHGLFYAKCIKDAGYVSAKDYARVNEEAIHIYEQIIRKERIDCDFRKLPSYLYTCKKTGVRELKEEALAAKSLGIHAKYVEGEDIKELPFSVEGAVRFYNQAQFHPLKFLMHLAKELQIYENTKVLSVNGHTVVTDKGTIYAENIIFACHYPITNLPGFYFLRQHQEKSYVMALQCEKALEGMYYGIDKNSLSFRSAEGALLLGGGGHRTGKCLCQLPEEEKQNYGYTFLKKEAAHYYPKLKEISHWSAQDCMSHDGIPFIGTYSYFRPYWYVATGFKKWGMTSSMVSAMILSDCISERISGFEKTFSPQRLLIRAGIKDFLVDVAESIRGLSKGLFSKKERRCPHMGCRLEWNNEEDRWDCPCHGSGFDKNGELLDNPAQTDIKKNKL